MRRIKRKIDKFFDKFFELVEEALNSKEVMDGFLHVVLWMFFLFACYFLACGIAAASLPLLPLRRYMICCFAIGGLTLLILFIFIVKTGLWKKWRTREGHR